MDPSTSQNSHALPVSSCDQQCARSEHVLSVSRLVWDCVVVPGWLGSAPSTKYEEHVDSLYGDASWKRHLLRLLRLGEALFPLAGLCCRRAAEDCRRVCVSRYALVALAAVAPAPSCLAWVVRHNRSGGSGGSDRAGEHYGREWRWQVTVKEVAWVMWGLCSSGNEKALSRMFGNEHGGTEGTFPALWDGRRIPEWDDDISTSSSARSKAVLLDQVCDYVKPVLDQACMSGDLNTVKWILASSTFGISRDEAPWRLLGPVKLALTRGHTALVKWLFDEYELLETYETHSEVLHELATLCAAGENPDCVKWAILDWVLLDPSIDILSTVLVNEHASLELCQWVQEKWAVGQIVSSYTIECISNPEIAKWALITLTCEFTHVDLSVMCASVGLSSFAEWLIAERQFVPTPSTFFMAGSCRSVKVEFLQWLSTNVALSLKDLIHTLINALLLGNTIVAAWLDQRFQSVACTCLDELCSTTNTEGLQWFLTNLTPKARSTISSDCVCKAINTSISTWNYPVTEMLLKAFPHFVPQTSVLEKIFIAFMKYGFSKLKWLVSFIDYSSLLAIQGFVANCLCTKKFFPYSTKVVKWIITQFHVGRSSIMVSHGRLLFRMLHLHKMAGAKWLIDTFKISFAEVMNMFDHMLPSADYFDINVATWRMLLNKFPEIDLHTINNHMMPIVARDSTEITTLLDAVRQYHTDKPEPSPTETGTLVFDWRNEIINRPERCQFLQKLAIILGYQNNNSLKRLLLMADNSGLHPRSQLLLQALFMLEEGSLDSAIRLVSDAFKHFESCRLTSPDDDVDEDDMLELCYLPGLLFLFGLGCVIKDHTALHQRLPSTLKVAFSRAVSCSGSLMGDLCKAVMLSAKSLVESPRNDEKVPPVTSLSEEWDALFEEVSRSIQEGDHNIQQSSWARMYYVALWTTFCLESSECERHWTTLSRMDVLRNSTTALQQTECSENNCDQSTVKTPEEPVTLLPSSSLSFLGLCYRYGLGGLDKDPNKAVSLFHSAAEDSGNPHATNHLGMCYKTGDGVDKDVNKAVTLFMQAADSGNVPAMNNLGVCYFHTGEGVEQDKKKGWSLFYRAADAGDSGAMLNLALLYQKVHSDPRESLLFFRWASDNGSRLARFQLERLLDDPLYWKSLA
ncbi:calmodulin-dependent protein kinase [Pelomyxa schiedti]|nr:calmodulin-dependent protein kinase [Pelomyxa schiedti]